MLKSAKNFVREVWGVLQDFSQEYAEFSLGVNAIARWLLAVTPQKQMTTEELGHTKKNLC